MPRTTLDWVSPLMRTGSKGYKREKRMVEEVTVHRAGLLQSSELLEAGEVGGQNSPRPEFIMEFCRSLLRSVGSWDLILLAAYSAKDRSGGTTAEMRQFLKLLSDWKGR